MLFQYAPLGPAQANCYIVGCPETKQAAVIDPGEDDRWIDRTVQDLGVTVKQIILTHAHMDHIGGVRGVKERYGARLLLHAAEAGWLGDPELNLSVWLGQRITAPPADAFLAEGDTVAIGTLRFQVLHTPGHSPGSISLYTPGCVICGDALFAGSIGRTDLPNADFNLLVRGIKTKLLTMPPETEAFPGHGPPTTIGDEKKYNPFLS